MGRLFYATLRQLKMTAKTIGSIFIGLIAKQEHTLLPERARKRVQRLA